MCTRMFSEVTGNGSMWVFILYRKYMKCSSFFPSLIINYDVDAGVYGLDIRCANAVHNTVAYITSCTGPYHTDCAHLKPNVPFIDRR